jgi:hypothetical protein
MGYELEQGKMRSAEGIDTGLEILVFCHDRPA